jgi:hypothetical protein
VAGVCGARARAGEHGAAGASIICAAPGCTRLPRHVYVCICMEVRCMQIERSCDSSTIHTHESVHSHSCTRATSMSLRHSMGRVLRRQLSSTVLFQPRNSANAVGHIFPRPKHSVLAHYAHACALRHSEQGSTMTLSHPKWRFITHTVCSCKVYQ